MSDHVSLAEWVHSPAFRAVMDHRARILADRGAIAPSLSVLFGSNALYLAIAVEATP
jgi:hypothetical protein